MPGKGRAFTSGNNANPRGRPRGVTESLPRNVIKRLAFAVVQVCLLPRPNM